MSYQVDILQSILKVKIKEKIFQENLFITHYTTFIKTDISISPEKGNDWHLVVNA